MSCRFWNFILFIMMGVLGSVCFAETTESVEPSTNEASAVASTPVEQCVFVCNRVAGSTRATSKFTKNCQKIISEQESLNTLYGQIQNVGKILDDALLKCLPSAGVKAIKSVPEFILNLPAMTYQLASALYNTIDQSEAALKAEKCFQSLDCRKGMMRQLIMYREQNTDGSFKVPDSKMIQELKDVDFNTLWVQSRFQFEGSRDECTRYLYDARSEVFRSGNEMDAQAQRAVYNKMAKEHTFCLGVLQLLPPEIDPRLQLNPSNSKPVLTQQETEGVLNNLNLIQQLAVGKACLGDEFDKIYLEFCADIVSVLVPVPVVGPQTRWLKSEAKAAVPAQTALSPANKLTSAAEASLVATNVAKTSLVQDYKGLILTTKEENNQFIELASKSNTGVLSSSRTRFLNVENSNMKFLNSVLPKELVTALTNFHKQKLDESIAALQTKYQKLYPGIQFKTYSDFKSVQVAIISPTDITAEMNQIIMKDLNEAFASANSALAAKMKEVGLDTEALKNKATALGMDPQVASDPNTWFRGAIGATPDETNLAARMAREQSGENKLFDFTQTSLQGQATEALSQIEKQRLELAQNSHLQQLMAKNERGLLLPRQEIFDMARKSKSSQDLAEAINLRFGKNRGFQPITVEEAGKLRDYVHDVNEFNPAIFIPERQVLSLDQANAGAASADFLGLGSENYWSTASAMAGRNTLSESLPAIRAQEQLVTQSFKARQARFQEIVGGDVTCSGDDCIKVFNQNLTSEQKGQLMDNLARDPQARRVRVSFIGPEVAAEHRVLLATHGEEIEKILRANLDGKIPYSKLSQLTFGLDMTSSQLNQGWVNLMVGKARTLRLSASEQQVILEAYEKAISQFNQTYSQYAAGTVSANVMGVHLNAGPALIMGVVPSHTRE